MRSDFLSAGFVALLGNNLGRFVNLLSPMILLFVALELKPLLLRRS